MYNQIKDTVLWLFYPSIHTHGQCDGGMTQRNQKLWRTALDTVLNTKFKNNSLRSSHKWHGQTYFSGWYPESSLLVSNSGEGSSPCPLAAHCACIVAFFHCVFGKKPLDSKVHFRYAHDFFPKKPLVSVHRHTDIKGFFGPWKWQEQCGIL